LPANGAELVVLSHLRWNFVWQRPYGEALA
jgi:hypothetical protein